MMTLLARAAVSAWYSWLAHRHRWLRNPFLGARPGVNKPAGKSPSVPSPQELQAILENLAPTDAAAVAVMAFRGLRVGALPLLTLVSGEIKCSSKGKPVRGQLPPVALEWIVKAGLDAQRPFAGTSGEGLSARLHRQITQLWKKKILSRSFSANAFRHYFTTAEYRLDPDIIRIQKLLGHSSPTVTERYLRSLELSKSSPEE